jgi:CHAD domain-containing protein
MSGRRDAWTTTARDALVEALETAARAFPTAGVQDALAVHGARRALKRAASLARWFLSVIGPLAYAPRDAANVARRAIGRARDLDVLPLALGKVKCDPEIREALTQALAQERGEGLALEPGLVAPEIVEALEAAARTVAGWDLSGANDEALLMALRTGYRTAKRRGRAAFATADSEELHRLRQGVVDLGHQMHVLAPAWPAMIDAHTGELHRLRQALGDYNDLTMLGEFALARREIEPAASKALIAAILRRRKPMERRARAQFERTFAERPGAFARRMAGYLAHPQGKSRNPEGRPQG